ncbi:MAG: hypothetical protein U0X75_28900 [Acidobacteriota bacterium]
MNISIVRKAATLTMTGLMLAVLSTNTLAQKTRTPAKKTTATSTTASASAPRFAYEHGYLAGSEDGYAKGRTDFGDGQPRDFANNSAYLSAERGYTERLGTRIEYQEGYRVGFELGYADGYYGRARSTTIPANLSRVVVGRINAANIVARDAEPVRTRPTDEPRTVATQPPAPRPAEQARADQSRPVDRTRDRAVSRPVVVIPDGVQMKIRLTSEINTKTNKEGDKFTAIVLDPSDYSDALVEGHISKLSQAGKASGKTELALAFDSIQLRDGRTGKLAAQVEKVYQSESVKTVDEEGNVETSSRTKETAVRSAGGAALGAIIGGIAGGGKGAAIGAAIGAGAGLGSVFIDGGKNLVLEPGTEMLVRTAAPARTRE